MLSSATMMRYYYVVWSRCQMNVGLVVPPQCCCRFWEQLDSTHSTQIDLANCKTDTTFQSLVPWRKLSGNSNGIKSGSFRHFVAFGLCFRHACLCDGAPILSAMTTPAKVWNVSIYRVSRFCDGDGALRRKAERTVFSVICSIPVTASLISLNCYSRAPLVVH